MRAGVGGVGGVGGGGKPENLTHCAAAAVAAHSRSQCEKRLQKHGSAAASLMQHVAL